MRRAFTWDQGTEMVEHEAITAATGLTIYFCDPASPWQRVTNENTNGVLKQHFPKGTDLSVHFRAELRCVQRELNNRPRKSLNGRSPAEVIASLAVDLALDRCDAR